MPWQKRSQSRPSLRSEIWTLSSRICVPRIRVGTVDRRRSWQRPYLFSQPTLDKKQKKNVFWGELHTQPMMITVYTTFVIAIKALPAKSPTPSTVYFAPERFCILSNEYDSFLLRSSDYCSNIVMISLFRRAGRGRVLNDRRPNDL